MRLPLGVAAAALWSPCVHGGTDDHRYKKGEDIDLWVDMVGPYANPQERYEYYTLPYCAPNSKHHPESDGGTSRWNEWKIYTMGENLGGHALRHSGHDITFLPTITNSSSNPQTCTTQPLTKEQADRFSKAIQYRWFYQMYLDDLPVWGMVGEMLPKPDKCHSKEKDFLDCNIDLQAEDDIANLFITKENLLDHMTDDVVDERITKLHPYVYTSRNLYISYNKDQIIKVDLTSDPKSLKEVKPGVILEFSLRVKFSETQDEFHSRFDRYLDHEIFKNSNHWFSVVNSSMLVLFLMGMIALILLRRLKKDCARYSLFRDLQDGGVTDENEMEALHRDDKVEDSGWKQIHGDVFRAPKMLPLLAALVGIGWQLLVLTLGVILYEVLGPLHGAVYEVRGELMHSILICYALTSMVSGYMSGKLLKEYLPTATRGRNAGGPAEMWQSTMGLTIFMVPTVSVAITLVLNTLSLIHGTINRVPFSVFLKLFFLWVFVSVPLCVVGTLLARHGNKNAAIPFPCRVNAIPRPIPDDVPWYGRPAVLIPLAGLLSFGSIFNELINHVLPSLWSYKFYHVHGTLLLVIATLTIVVGMTSIIVVYYCLNAENYLWQWTAFGSGASTAGYFFLYGIYYCLFATQMHGILQTSIYFGYMTLMAITLALLCGTMGHASASRFVRAIFHKDDQRCLV